MSLDKGIEHGKEHRKPYYKSGKHDKTCRPGGGCPYCTNNRQFGDKRREQSAKDQLKESDMPITAKRVLRAMRPLQEATSDVNVAQETRKVKAFLQQSNRKLEAAERTIKNTSFAVAELISSVMSLLNDVAVSVETLVDAGRSGVDPRVTALDNLADGLTDAEDDLRKAWDALGKQGRIPKPAKGQPSTVGQVRANYRTVATEARSLLRTLEKVEREVQELVDDFWVPFDDLDSEDVYREFEDEAADVEGVAGDLVSDLRYATEALENAVVPL